MNFNERLDKSKPLNDYMKTYISESYSILKGEPLGNEVDGRSKIVWKIAKKDLIALKANLNHAIRGKDIVIIETNVEDEVYYSKISEIALNRLWNKRENSTALKNKIITRLCTEGNAVVRIGVKRQGKLTIPYSIVCNLEKLYIDPTAKYLDDADYIIYKFEDSYERIMQREDYSEEAKIKLKNARNSYLNDDFIERDETDSLIETAKIDNDEMVVLYEYWYKKNGKIYFEIHAEYQEYDGYTESSITKTTRLKKTANPFEFNKFPFVHFMLYYPEKGIWSASLPKIVEDEQRTTTGIVRGVLDNIAQSNNAMKFFKKGALDTVNKQKIINGEPIVEINSRSRLQDVMIEGNFNPIPQSVFGVLQMIEGQSDNISGVSKFAQGAISSDELKAPASNFSMMMNVSQLKIEDILENMEYALNQMFEMWITIIWQFMDEEQLEYLTGIDLNMIKQIEFEKMVNQYQLNQIPDIELRNKAKMFILKKLEEMFNHRGKYIHINIKISSQAKTMIKLNSINMLMQNAANLAQAGIIDPKALKLLSAELADTLGHPEIAEIIRNYEPQPDPMQVQAMQVELAEKQAKAQKEAALAQNAMARTQLTAVKAQKDAKLIDPEVGSKYIELAKELKELNNPDAQQEALNKLKGETK